MKIVTLETWNFILELIEKEIINNDSMTDKEKVDALWQKFNNLKRMFYSTSEWKEDGRNAQRSKC